MWLEKYILTPLLGCREALRASMAPFFIIVEGLRGGRCGGVWILRLLRESIFLSVGFTVQGKTRRTRVLGIRVHGCTLIPTRQPTNILHPQIRKYRPEHPKNPNTPTPPSLYPSKYNKKAAPKETSSTANSIYFSPSPSLLIAEKIALTEALVMLELTPTP